MAGYTRQSVADIISGEVVKAAPLNAEFNALRDAFVPGTGHTHDGSTGNGAYITTIAGEEGFNKVFVDEANNRISFFIEISGAAVEQLRIQDGAIVPVTDDDIDLGASGAEFKDLYIDGTANLDAVITAAITATGGNIDGTIIGANTAAAGSFTDLTSTGTSTHATVDINGGVVDGTVIGASSAAAGSFTTVSTSGQATLASADINGGTVDGAVIGGSTPAAGTFTNLTANTSIAGTLTGDVTGNLTGNVTGNVTGNLTGNVTGNVTSSGTSTFNDVTINGTVDFTDTRLTNIAEPTAADDAATKNYVDTEIASVIDSAPAALDTLNELAAALGDDANFSTTVTNSIATKLPLAGGTMSGAIAMGTSKITGMGDPTANQDAATKVYVDTQDATKLSLSGGTMTGNIVLGANKATSTATPSADDDLTRKAYVDSILGSATSAADSAAAAATSASNAATSETNAGNSATAAASSASDAATSYDNFDDRYLGQKASDPSVDNDGDALLTGALYFNTTDDRMKVYTGSAWVDVAPTATSITEAQISDLGTTIVLDTDIGSTVQGYDAGLAYLDGLNFTDEATFKAGVNLEIGTDVQAFDADTAKTDTAQTFTADQTFSDNTKAIFGAGSDLQIYHLDSSFNLDLIDSSGTGGLQISADGNFFLKHGSDFAIQSTVNGAVDLYYDNSIKFETTTTGVDVSGRATGTVTAENDGSFDLSASNQFTCTPTAAFDLTFTNEAAGQSGMIYLSNTSNYTATADADVHISAADLTAISATGTYIISYYCPDGTNVYLSASAALTEGS